MLLRLASFTATLSLGGELGSIYISLGFWSVFGRSPVRMLISDRSWGSFGIDVG